MFEISCCLSKKSRSSLFFYAKPVRPMTSPIRRVMIDGDVEMVRSVSTIV